MADPLTGFASHPDLVAAVDDAIAGASPAERRDLWVGVVAIPRLPFVNAGFGPDVGDDVIRGVARTIVDELPEAFITARLEGAELAMASFGPARRLSLRHVDDPVRFIGIAVESAGTRLFTNLRAGIAHYSEGDDGDTLLGKARLAVALAREEGSDDLVLYSEELGAQAREHVDVARNLLHAIENDALELRYQPKVDIRSGTMIGVEALVRWPTPDGGSVSPATFVPVAEASGLIVKLGDWVLREGCRQAARWCDGGLPRFHVAINVSALQFQKTDIVARTSDLLEETGARPDWLELELTEGALASDAGAMVRRLTALRDLGIDLAIDDFGTGYSSLSYLKRFPVHRLKIDQSFVRSSHESPKDRAIVRSVIAIGHNLGLKVIAEGVEREAHARLLAEEACEEAQGYYYARPLLADDLTAFARERGVKVDDGDG
jgi:EAL domain-containing protein (putative c-di-GMP-specific phosphodiesterase class I)